MLNKKGMSLIELVIAVALISVVIVFLYSLLSDLNNEITNSNFAINNQINRFEIIKTVQNDALGEDIKDINIDNNNNIITIKYESGLTTIINYTETSVTVTDKYSLKTKWEIDDTVCYFGEATESTFSSSYFEGYEISLPVYTTNDSNNSSNNNVLDDITFTFITEE